MAIVVGAAGVIPPTLAFRVSLRVVHLPKVLRPGHPPPKDLTLLMTAATPELGIGRGGNQAGGGLCLACDPMVSDRHALIHLRPRRRGLYIRDLGSTNGTLLIDEKMAKTEVYQLRSGDTLTLGGSKLVVEFSEEHGQHGEAVAPAKASVEGGVGKAGASSLARNSTVASASAQSPPRPTTGDAAAKRDSTPHRKPPTAGGTQTNGASQEGQAKPQVGEGQGTAPSSAPSSATAVQPSVAAAGKTKPGKGTRPGGAGTGAGAASAVASGAASGTPATGSGRRDAGGGVDDWDDPVGADADDFASPVRPARVECPLCQENLTKKSLVVRGNQGVGCWHGCPPLVNAN